MSQQILHLDRFMRTYTLKLGAKTYKERKKEKGMAFWMARARLLRNKVWKVGVGRDSEGKKINAVNANRHGSSPSRTGCLANDWSAVISRNNRRKNRPPTEPLSPVLLSLRTSCILHLDMSLRTIARSTRSRWQWNQIKTKYLPTPQNVARKHICNIAHLHPWAMVRNYTQNSKLGNLKSK